MSENALFIPLAAEAVAGDTNRGWVQLARLTNGIGKNADKKFEIVASDLDAFAAYIKANPDRISIDYDHSHGNDRGTRAAGWIDAATAEVRNGNELWAQVDWTPPAAQMIRDGEYRYISPELKFKSNKDGILRRAAEFAAAALTNRPWFKDMAAVSLSESTTSPEGDNMTTELNKALGLSEDADEKLVLAAIKKRDDDAVALQAKVDESTAALETAKAELDTLKTTASDADKKVAELSTTVAGLLKANHDARLSVLLDNAIKATKIDPAQREAMVTLAEKAGVEAVEALIAATPERPLNKGTGSGGDSPLGGVKLSTKVDGVETPIDPESAELAAKVDAYIVGLKLDHEPTVEDYLRAHDAVLSLA